MKFLNTSRNHTTNRNDQVLDQTLILSALESTIMIQSPHIWTVVGVSTFIHSSLRDSQHVKYPEDNIAKMIEQLTFLSRRQLNSLF